MLVAGLEVVLEAPLQIRYGMEDAAAKPLFGPRAEASLDPVQPRRAGRRKGPEEALLPLDPVQDLGGWGGVVIQDEGDHWVLGPGFLHWAKAFHPLRVAGYVWPIT